MPAFFAGGFRFRNSLGNREQTGIHRLALLKFADRDAVTPTLGASS
jgi:hypothetical protein